MYAAFALLGDFLHSFHGNNQMWIVAFKFCLAHGTFLVIQTTNESNYNYEHEDLDEDRAQG